MKRYHLSHRKKRRRQNSFVFRCIALLIVLIAAVNGFFLYRFIVSTQVVIRKAVFCRKESRCQEAIIYYQIIKQIAGYRMYILKSLNLDFVHHSSFQVLICYLFLRRWQLTKTWLYLFLIMRSYHSFTVFTTAVFFLYTSPILLLLQWMIAHIKYFLLCVHE